MSNMSYCRFENTLNDLRDCAYAIGEWDGEESGELSSSEKSALENMVIVMEGIISDGDIIEEMLNFDRNDR